MNKYDEVNLGFFKERCAALSIGLLANWAICKVVDYVLFPFVILQLGLIRGGVVMLLLCFAVCYSTLLLYDRSENDWLGIEAIKGIGKSADQWKSNKLTSWILRQSTPISLLLLSIKFDPFITTAYLRSGTHTYLGLSHRDWKIFISSLLIGNLYWMLASVGLLEHGWKHFVK